MTKHADTDLPDEPLILSHLALRQALGWLGLGLPAALLAHAAMPGNHLEASISDYHFTAMGGFLTGVLSAIGVFLLAYRGYARKVGEWLSDRWLSRIGGSGALGVALLPVHREGYPVCLGDPPTCWAFGASAHPEALHYGAAFLFFVSLALFALVQFPRGERDTTGRLVWSARTVLFLLSGTTILAAMTAMVPYFLADAEAKAALSERHYLFWCETMAVVAFSASWLVKGRALAAMRATMARVARRP